MLELFVSHFNRLAVDAIRNYIPDQAQPVTLIYGPSGVGKTELLRKVYHEHKNPQVLLIDSLAFSQNYVLAAQDGSLNDFRKLVRSFKLIIFDRLEALKGKKQTLEELLHTLDALISQGGKFVACFQGEPQELNFLGQRLVSRLLGGMTLPISAPTHNELVDFANRYARSRFWALPEIIIDNIAHQASNLREVQRLIQDFGVFSARVQNTSDEFTEYYWKRFSNELKEQKEMEMTADNILRKVSELTGVLPGDIRGNSRASAAMAARKFAVYTIRKFCAWSYPQLGEYFQKAHSAMIKSCRRFEELMETEPEWREKFAILQAYFDQDEG